MIKISSPENQLRSNATLLKLVGGSAAVIGFLLWSASPFLFPNPKDKVNITLRYLSLFGSTCCGITAVAMGHQLHRIAPLIKAIEQAEKADFISQLATSQWVQEQRYQSEAVTALQPSQQQPIANNSNDRNDHAVRDNEVSNEYITDSATAVTTATPTAMATPTDDAMEGYKPMYLLVMTLKNQGIAESDIIKDALKMGGVNYQKGKEMLDALLQLGASQQW